MTVSLKIGRQVLDIDLDAAIAVNNALSTQYKTEANPEKRREIISILYKLNLPLFKKWRLFNFEEKEDYEQEAFFWIARALDTFDPAKGAFLAWLKSYYVRESQRQYMAAQSKRQRAQEAALAQPEDPPPEPTDTLFWTEAEAILGEDWSIVRAVLFESKTMVDIAKIRGVPRKTADNQYRRGLDTLRIHLAKRAVKASTLQESPGEGEWVGFKKFCRIMTISPNYLQNLLNKNRPASVCPLYINPLHYTPLQGGRIRYLFTPSRGLVYPEILRKKP